MHWFGIVLIASMAGVMLFAILAQLAVMLRKPRRKGLVNVPASILLIVGIIAHYVAVSRWSECWI